MPSHKVIELVTRYEELVANLSHLLLTKSKGFVANTKKNFSLQAMHDKFKVIMDEYVKLPEFVSLKLPEIKVPKNIKKIEIFNMKQNKGHARCNAFAIRYLSKKDDFDHLIVMDGDGEDRPEEIKNFVEETLRIESPTQGLFRSVKENCNIGGVDIPAGSTLSIRYGAGNRDPERYSCPMEPDLNRKNAGRHLAFGLGEHVCPGATLSRYEQRWAWEILLSRLKNLRPTPGRNNFTHIY